MKEFKKEFNINGHLAKTLNKGDIGTHDNGWTVTGEIHEDYFEWVNEFEAIHINGDKVWGDFEKTVFATSEAAYNDFVKHFPPSDWDYWDI